MKRTIVSVALALGALGLFACGKDEPKSTRWDQAASAAAKSAEKKAEAPKDAPSAAPPPEKKETGAFNKFFPADGVDGTKRVFSADKDGYAEAKLTKDSKEVALLSVTDLNGKDDEKKKFDAAKEKVNGNPVATFGKNKSMILVKSRYQVAVSSQTLDHEARKGWISKFDLNGISAL
jgi:hypothetical protein